MASSVLVRIPFGFFRSSVCLSLSNGELGLYMRLYAQAVGAKTEFLPREVLILEHGDTSSTEIIRKLKELGLLEAADNGIRVVGCGDNHKSLDFDGLKKQARESAPIKEVPGPISTLDQLNANADLCNRFPELMKSWQQTYPLINISLELIKANNWLMSNPKKKRPSKVRFLAHWFKNAQSYAERRGSTGGTGVDSPVSQWEGGR